MKIKLTKKLAEAIIEMDDIGYCEGFGPHSEEGKIAWEELLHLSEELVNYKTIEHRQHDFSMKLNSNICKELECDLT